MDRDHNNERGFVHPFETGRYAVGYEDVDGRFVTLWTSDTEHPMFAENGSAKIIIEQLGTGSLAEIAVTSRKNHGV